MSDSQQYTLPYICRHIFENILSRFCCIKSASYFSREIMKGKYSKPIELSDEEFLAQFENPSLTPIPEGDHESKDGEDESKEEKINIE